MAANMTPFDVIARNWSRFLTRLLTATRKGAAEWQPDEVYRGKWTCEHALGSKKTDPVVTIQLTLSLQPQGYYLVVVCTGDACMIGPEMGLCELQELLSRLYAAVSKYDTLLETVGQVLDEDVASADQGRETTE